VKNNDKINLVKHQLIVLCTSAGYLSLTRGQAIDPTKNIKYRQTC
jgi:hypothetical protein